MRQAAEMHADELAGPAVSADQFRGSVRAAPRRDRPPAPSAEVGEVLVQLVIVALGPPDYPTESR